jgi:hypothetical protein
MFGVTLIDVVTYQRLEYFSHYEMIHFSNWKYPMNQKQISIANAREALAKLPRCNAKSRQTGEPCKLAGLGKGGKCRFHGGASTGRPITSGKNTKQALLAKDTIRLLLGVIKTMQGGKLKSFKPGHMTESRYDEISNRLKKA